VTKHTSLQQRIFRNIPKNSCRFFSNWFWFYNPLLQFRSSTFFTYYLYLLKIQNSVVMLKQIY